MVCCCPVRPRKDSRCRTLRLCPRRRGRRTFDPTNSLVTPLNNLTTPREEAPLPEGSLNQVRRRRAASVETTARSASPPTARASQGFPQLPGWSDYITGCKRIPPDYLVCLYRMCRWRTIRCLGRLVSQNRRSGEFIYRLIESWFTDHAAQRGLAGRIFRGAPRRRIPTDDEPGKQNGNRQ